MQTVIRVVSRGVAAAFLSVMPTSWASTQSDRDNQTDSGSRNVDITITAAKRPKSVAMTPGEVGVVGLDEIEASQAQDLEDILKYQPGIEVDGGPRGVGQRPNIRGLGGQRVLVTVDGVRLNFDTGHKGSVFFEPDWIARAEVLRGPGSALYGSGALGGTLNLRTLEPGDLLTSDENGGYRLRLGYQAGNEEIKASPTLFGKLGGGAAQPLEYLLSYTLRDSNNIELGNGDTLDFSSEDADSWLGKVIWRPTAADKLTFSAMRFDTDMEIPLNTTDVTTAPASLGDRETLQTTYSLSYQHRSLDHNWLNIQGTLYRTEMELFETRLSDGREEDTHFDTDGLDFRNTSFFEFDGTTVALTYGFEYFEDTQKGTRNGGPSLFFPDAESEQRAVYLEAELSFFDELLTIIPGVRDDEWEMDSAALAMDEDAVSPKVGAILRLDDELNLAEGDYLIIEGNIADGFRAPNFGELFVAGTHFPGAVFASNTSLKPETSENWELGTRLKIADVEFTATYFENDAEDFIDYDVVFVPPFGPLTFTPENIDNATIDGLELSANWQAQDNLVLWANYTRTRGDNETDNEPLASIAADRITLGADYLIADWGLTLSSRVRIVDDQDRVPAGGTPSDNYTLVDILATWKPQDLAWEWLEDFRFDVGIENLFDEAHEPYLAGVPGAGINPKATITYTRTW